MEFKDRLKKYRLDNQMTQEDLAKKLCVSRQAVSKYETGRGYPNLETMQQISKLLDVSLEELLSKKELTKETLISNQKNRRNRYIFLILFILFIGIASITFLALFIAYKNKEYIDKKEEAWKYDLIGMVGKASDSIPTFEELEEESVFGYYTLIEDELHLGKGVNVAGLGVHTSERETNISMDVLFSQKAIFFNLYEVYYKPKEKTYYFQFAYKVLPHQIKTINFNMERDEFRWEFTFNFKAIDELQYVKIYEFDMTGKVLKESLLASNEYTISPNCLYVVIEEEFLDSNGKSYKNREVIYNYMIDKTYFYTLKTLNEKGFCTENLIIHKY